MIYNVGKYKDRDTYLRKSYESTQELKLLVNEMMEISKMEILEKDLQFEDINLSELINNLVQKQIYLIENKNLKLIYKVEKNLMVKADREKIIRALNNIINNAIKYSPENEKIIIKSFKSKASKTVVLEVENTGVTIENKYLNEVFDPFSE